MSHEPKHTTMLVHGSWRDTAPEEVDEVLCDPPYTEHVHEGHVLPVRDREAVPFDPAHPEDFLPELLGRARRWVVCFCAFEALGDYCRIAGDAWVRSGIWLKTNPAPQMSGDRPGTPGEAIAIMHNPGRKVWNGGGKVALWRHAPAHGAERCHPTPKPVSLMLDLVRDFTMPGELVWDPFAGGGTTGVACMKLGRRFLGHELEHEHAEVAARRLDRVQRTIDREAAAQQPFGEHPEEAAVLARLHRLLGRGLMPRDVARTLNRAGAVAPPRHGTTGRRSARWTRALVLKWTRVPG